MTSTLINEKLTLNGASPSVELTGTEGSADPVTIRENAGYVEIYDQSTSAATAKINVANGGITLVGAGNITMMAAGAGTFTTGTGTIALNGSPTVATGKTLAITDADKLTVAGIIVPQYLVINVSLDALSTDQWVFVADAAYELVSLETIFAVTATGACNLDLKKSTSVQAPASGTSMLTAVVALQATANTVYAGTPHGTEATRRIADGNTMSLTLSDQTPDGLAGCVVTIRLKRV
jgi:hypothetical protein